MANDYLKDIIVLIPSLNPDDELYKYVKELKVQGVENIVIVDDGSCKECQHIFNKLYEFQGIIILRHAINLGKGRALKTGFNYILNNYAVGVITADADGQHSVKDTLKLAKLLSETRNFILGTRDFDKKTIPFKSKFGNKMTTLLFWILYGKKVSDTQTGLRAIPYDYLGRCLNLEGERFEYEIMMIIDAVKSGRHIKEEKIETIYINSNRKTHFHAIRDSLKIYKVIFSTFLKFSISSIASFVVDIGIFALFTKVFLCGIDIRTQIFIGTVAARVISSLLNFVLNRNAVFSTTASVYKSLIKYYILCVIQMICSGVLVVFLFKYLKFDTTILKCLVDVMLFIISYQIQRLWVFKER